MRSGAAKKLEHKHVDLKVQVIRLPIELSKNKTGLTIPLRGRLLVLCKKLGITGHLSVLICFIIRLNPLGTFGRHLTPLARLPASKESYLTIFVDLLFGISFELVSKSLSL